jgi:taurine dioxygenase
MAEQREVFEIDYTRARKGLGDRGREYSEGDNWHTDVTSVETPPLGSILNAIVIPAAGGDTLGADTRAAYEGLSQPIKDLVDGLTAVHDGRRAFGRILQAVGKGKWDGEEFTELTPVEHPVVRTHPETGRRNLFVNTGFTVRIKGLTAKESDTLLGQPDDNALRHHYGDAHRVIQRVTIKGRQALLTPGFWNVP